jgi:predicted  nucleic acid-binding Zn-ribbon protein
MLQQESRLPAAGIESLRKKINNEEYLYEAIQRIALVLSNEIQDMNQKGDRNERKGRK